MLYNTLSTAVLVLKTGFHFSHMTLSTAATFTCRNHFVNVIKVKKYASAKSQSMFFPPDRTDR